MFSSASYNRFLWQIRQNRNMKSLFPIFAVLAAATAQAQVPARIAAKNPSPPAATADASKPSPEVFVGRVVNTTVGQASISAKLRHRVELAGRALIGTGVYLQQGRGEPRAFRLALELRTTLNATSLQHVCDGQRLWIREELDGNENLSVIDVARLYQARPKSNAPQPPQTALLSLGGLPKLLVRLHETFVFDSIEESRLDDLRVWSIEGTWRRHHLVQMLPGQKETIQAGGEVNFAPLAENLPHRVVLHVGCDDLFPYRIEYWRNDWEEGEEDGPGRPRLMAVLELYEVQLGPRIDPGQFTFHPGKLVPKDLTIELLNRLGLEDPPPQEAKRQLRSPL